MRSVESLCVFCYNCDMRKNSKICVSRAFTLVEVIIVIGVLIVLTGIAIPVVSGYLDRAATHSCRVNMQAVMLAYRSRTDALYGDVDAEGALSRALAYGDYTVNSATSYTAPCGGECTVTYSSDYRHIENIVCSLHGSLESDIDGLPDSSLAPNIPLVEAYDASVSAGHNMPQTIDSTAIVVSSAWVNYMQEYMVGEDVDFAALNVKSWAITHEGGYKIVWFSDQDITKYDVGDWVRVIRYNSKTKTYTAGYKQVTENTLDGVTYKVFSRGAVSSATWAEYTGTVQTGTTKSSYEKTVEVFNSMQLTKS